MTKKRSFALAAVFVVCCGCEFGYEWHATLKAALPPCDVQANVDAFTEPEPLDPGDERFFRRIQSHIDRRVEERLVSAMNEAAGVKKSGLGSILAGAIAAVVKAILLAIIEAIVVAVIVALVWKYLVWVVAIVLAWLGFSALAGYLGGRSAARKGVVFLAPSPPESVAPVRQ